MLLYLNDTLLYPQYAVQLWEKTQILDLIWFADTTYEKTLIRIRSKLLITELWAQEMSLETVSGSGAPLAPWAPRPVPSRSVQ